MDLASICSMLVANFAPIRDSVNRCELRIDSVIKADSLFAKQSRIGQTIRLLHDYLTTNVAHRIIMNVYGEMWGLQMLLYTGDTLITALPGLDATYDVNLAWVGPNTPPDGAVSMVVSLGSIGTTTINGQIEGPAMGPSTGLVAYYPFNGNAIDESGSNLHGVVQGATLTRDRLGNLDRAYHFDGLSNYIYTTGLLGISGSQPRSLSFWMKGTGTLRQAMAGWGASGQDRAFVAEHSVGSPHCATGKLFFVGYWNDLCTGITVNEDVWHHVAMTYDGITVSIYADGVLVASQAKVLSTVNSVFNIGRQIYMDRPDLNGYMYFTGDLDEVRVYNRALTGSEVSALSRS